MTQDLNDLERDIEESRARLDLTIHRLQDKMSASGIVDDVLGTLRVNQYGSIVDHAMAVVRRNPVPVMLVAAGVGWLIYRMAKDEERATRARTLAYAEPELPLVTPGQARIYDPGMEPVRPMHDRFAGDPLTGGPLGQDPLAQDALVQDPLAPQDPLVHDPVTRRSANLRA
ncbi:MAG TPA: DUF3618 domain-containing protein [Microvirga sp.]|jgi:hypothetical protein